MLEIFKKKNTTESISVEQHNKVVAALQLKIDSLESDKLSLRATVTALSHPEDKEQKSIIDITLGDHIPTDTEARKMYVASVAGFFKEIMQKKLEFMIANTHNMLEETTNDRDFDLMLKGAVYSFRELLVWGKLMLNEQMANQTENVSEEDIQSLKDKLQEN